jgi:hypothetical protein
VIIKNYVKEYISIIKAQKGNETLAISLYEVKWEALNDRLTDATKKNLLTEKQEDN